MNRRARWAGVAALCAMVLAACYCASVWWLGASVQRQYDAGDYGAAVATAEWQKRLAAAERHKPYFNAGTARAAAGQLPEARSELERALELSPPRESCPIILNLALVIESLGDAENPGGERPPPATAEELYLEARSLLTEAPEHCGGEGEAGAEAAAEAEERLEEKLSEEQGDSGGGGGSSDPSDPGGGDPAEELRERNRDAAREQRRADESGRQQERSPVQPEKPW